MFQSIPKYFQITTGNDKFSEWKSTWLSEESNKTLALSDNSFAPKLTFIYNWSIESILKEIV